MKRKVNFMTEDNLWNEFLIACRRNRTNGSAELTKFMKEFLKKKR